MSQSTVVHVLTGLAAVVVVLTRVRLARDASGAGRAHLGRGLVNAHSVVGLLALASWTVFLVAPADSAAGGEVLGIVALGLWWAVAVIGLLVLARWLPTRGRHASAGAEDSWSEGPGLSVLAHVGMLLGVLVFTWAYLVEVV